MNTINTNRLAVVTLSTLSALSGLVSAQAQKPTIQQQWAKQNSQTSTETLRSTRDFSTKASADAAAAARQKLGFKTTVVYDAKNHIYILREYSDATTPPTPKGYGSLVSRREFGTQVSANAAAAARRKLGYKTTVVYDAKNHVYILREYSRPK